MYQLLNPQPNISIGPLLLIFLLAMVFTFAATPVARRLAHRYSVVDAPSARKIHTNPVPLLGGIAIYGAVMVSLMLFGHLQYVQQTASILIGATLMSMLGVWDDKWGLRPVAKLWGVVRLRCFSSPASRSSSSQRRAQLVRPCSGCTITTTQPDGYRTGCGGCGGASVFLRHPKITNPMWSAYGGVLVGRAGLPLLQLQPAYSSWGNRLAFLGSCGGGG